MTFSLKNKSFPKLGKPRTSFSWLGCRIYQGLFISFLVIIAEGETFGRAQSPSELLSWTTRAMGQIVEGKLVAAVQSIIRARQAAALPELDALVGLVGLLGERNKEALDQLTASIDHGSTEPMVFYWTARAAWNLGQRDLALRRMHEAATLAPHHSTIRMGQTLMLLAAGRRNHAVKTLVVVAALEPNILDPILYPSPAEGAITLLGKILKDSAQLQVIRTQGYLYWQAKRVTAALRSFSEIFKQRPQDGDALQMIARCQMALGQDALARATAEQAVQLAPDFSHVYATRGEILLDQGQPERAIADLQRAANAFPRDSQILTRLAEACAQAEQAKCTKRYFTYAVERDQNNAAAHFGLALVYQQDHQEAQAEASFQRAIRLRPGQAKYYQGAAHLARLQGKVQMANKLMAQARELAGLERRHKQIFIRINNQIARQTEALSILAEHPQCPKECQVKLRFISSPARQFIKIHLAQKRQQTRQAEQLASSLINQLNPSLLLKTNPTVMIFKGKTINGDYFSVRNTFPFVPPGRFK